MDDYQAGTLQVTFTNNDRTYDPTNTSSSLWYGAGGYTMVQPGAQVRVTLNSTIVFYGWVQDWAFTYDNAGFDGNAVMTAGDLMYYLSRINFTGSTEPLSAFADDRITSVLSSYGLPTSGVANRNSKTMVGQDVHNAGDNVLSYVQNVARSEPGDLFASAGSSAVLTFKDRTFTDYSWTTTYRRNVVKYPSANTTDVWLSPYLASAATPYYPGGTPISSSVYGSNTSHQVDYYEINQASFNPTGTATHYLFNVWVRGNGGTVGIDAYVDLLDAQGNAITTPAIITPFVSGTAGSNLTWINLRGTVNSNGSRPVAGMNFVLSCAGTTNNYSFISDGFHVEDTGTYDGTYFDGSNKFVTSTTGVKYEVAWDGSPHSSSSTMGINTAGTATSATYLTFADANSQGASYGNGTAIPFMTLELASSGLTLYNQTQIVGVTASGTATDTAGTALYGLRVYTQGDNLTTSITRPGEIAQDVLGFSRLPEYRAQQFTVALEGLTTAQQNLVLGLELRDVIRLCFQPSAQGQIVDKYYQILSIDIQADTERNHVSFQVASLANVPVRLDSTVVAKLDSCVLG